MSYQTINPDEIGQHLGARVCVYYPSKAMMQPHDTPGCYGQGGEVLRYDDDSITIINGPGTEIRFERGEIHQIALEDEDGNSIPTDPCLNEDEDCVGPVRFWYSGATHASWPRCTYHGEKRLQDHENSIERYANSDVAPSWFREDNIGERWNDDDY